MRFAALRREWARRPVSRVLCRFRADAETRRPFLWTGPCGTVLATNPDDSGLRQPYPLGSGRIVPIRSCSRRGLPCRPCRQVRGGLLPHPFTLAPRFTHARRAVCFLWRCPWDRSRRALPAALSPWSPDFPPPPQLGRERPPGRLAQLGNGLERHRGQQSGLKVGRWLQVNGTLQASSSPGCAGNEPEVWGPRVNLFKDWNYAGPRSSRRPIRVRFLRTKRQLVQWSAPAWRHRRGTVFSTMVFDIVKQGRRRSGVGR